MLQTGDCFDIDDSRTGQATPRSCSEPHAAEVVKIVELEGGYTSDTVLREAASALCVELLERKAAQQPADVVRGALVP